MGQKCPTGVHANWAIMSARCAYVPLLSLLFLFFLYQLMGVEPVYAVHRLPTGTWIRIERDPAELYTRWHKTPLDCDMTTLHARAARAADLARQHRELRDFATAAVYSAIARQLQAELHTRQAAATTSSRRARRSPIRSWRAR
jgi:hypothetical protein